MKASIKVNYENIVGAIKPMHGVGQPPLVGTSTAYFKYLKDAHIPYSRLHDVAGWFGGNLFVDIPNIFRDFSADETDPKSYDFTFTDILIKGLYEYGCKPVYRLGVTIENFFEIKIYRTHPPEDFGKWARICEHIIRHYNEGWADGFEYGIEYWEVWNEPEVGIPPNGMWTGTMEDYFDLYEITAKHLKKCFGDSIKIGGYACSGLYGLFADPEKYGIPSTKLTGERYEGQKEGYRIRYFYSFLDFIRKHDVPLDFFSWHSYMDIEKTGICADFFARELAAHGYGDVEIHLNEWNPAFGPNMRQTSFAAAQTACMMLMMQDKPIDMLNYYDAQIGVSQYGGLFNPLTREPLATYYGLYVFGEMYHDLKRQAKCEVEGRGVYAVAATDGNRRALMLANATAEDIEIETNLEGDMDVYVIDENHYLTKEDIRPNQFTIRGNQIVYIRK